jgi:hypothetical protein
MLEPDHWDAVLSTVTATTYRDTERLSTAYCLDLSTLTPPAGLSLSCSRALPRSRTDRECDTPQQYGGGCFRHRLLI